MLYIELIFITANNKVAFATELNTLLWYIIHIDKLFANIWQ